MQTLGGIISPGFRGKFGPSVMGMDYVPGNQLLTTLQQATKEQARILIQAMGQVMRSIHEAGFTHNDLSTANVLLTPDNKLLAIDFANTKPISANSKTAAREKQADIETAITRSNVGKSKEELAFFRSELLKGYSQYSGTLSPVVVPQLSQIASSPAQHQALNLPLNLPKNKVAEPLSVTTSAPTSVKKSVAAQLPPVNANEPLPKLAGSITDAIAQLKTVQDPKLQIEQAKQIKQAFKEAYAQLGAAVKTKNVELAAAYADTIKKSGQYAAKELSQISANLKESGHDVGLNTEISDAKKYINQILGTQRRPVGFLARQAVRLRNLRKQQAEGGSVNPRLLALLGGGGALAALAPLAIANPLLALGAGAGALGSGLMFPAVRRSIGSSFNRFKGRVMDWVTERGHPSLNQDPRTQESASQDSSMMQKPLPPAGTIHQRVGFRIPFLPDIPDPSLWSGLLKSFFAQKGFRLPKVNFPWTKQQLPPPFVAPPVRQAFPPFIPPSPPRNNTQSPTLLSQTSNAHLPRVTPANAKQAAPKAPNALSTAAEMVRPDGSSSRTAANPARPSYTAPAYKQTTPPTAKGNTTTPSSLAQPSPVPAPRVSGILNIPSTPPTAARGNTTTPSSLAQPSPVPAPRVSGILNIPPSPPTAARNQQPQSPSVPPRPPFNVSARINPSTTSYLSPLGLPTVQPPTPQQSTASQPPAQQKQPSIIRRALGFADRAISAPGKPISAFFSQLETNQGWGKTADNIDKAKNKVKEFFKSVQQPGQPSGFIQNLLEGLKTLKDNWGAVIFSASGFFVFQAAGQALLNFGKASVDTAIKIKNLERAITFAASSPAKAEKSIAFVRAQSEELGLNVETSLTGYKQLSASTIGTTLEGAPTDQLFNALQEAGATLALAPEQMQRAQVAFSQMAAKGRIASEELFGQASEAIPSIAGVFSRALGVSSQQLRKMGEQGLLQSNEVLPLVAAQLSAESKSGLREASDSPQANFNRLNNAIVDLQTTVGQGLLPIVETITKSITFLIRGLTENFGTMLVTLGAMTAATFSFIRIPLVAAIQEMIVATLDWAKVMNLTRGTLLAATGKFLLAFAALELILYNYNLITRRLPEQELAENLKQDRAANRPEEKLSEKPK